MQLRKLFPTLFILISIGLSACQNATLAPTQSDPLSAGITGLEGRVQVKEADAAEFAAAQLGMTLVANGTVRTESDGRARLDLSSGTIVRVAPSSVFTLISNEVQPDQSLVTKIKLELGQIFIVLNGGSAEVETPSGQASVRGSYMMVKIDPVTKTVKVTCLEGDCVAKTKAGQVNFSAGQVVILTLGDLPPELGEMSPEDFEEWLSNVPESLDVLAIATATIAARASATPTITATPAKSPTPTATVTSTPLPCSTLVAPAEGASFEAYGKVAFSWSAFPGAAKYNILFTDSNGAVSKFNQTDVSMVLYIEHLPAGGNYTWQVLPVDANGTPLCESNVFTFTKSESPTSTPLPVDNPTVFGAPSGSLDTFYLPCSLYVNVTPSDPEGVVQINFYVRVNSGGWAQGSINPDGDTWYGYAPINNISSAADTIYFYFSSLDGAGNIVNSVALSVPGGYCP